MTENKKKTTKKEVVEKSETPVKEVKRARTKEKIENQDVSTETLPSDEVITVVAEEIPEVEVAAEAVNAEDYGFESESKKEKRSHKSQTEPDTDPGKEIYLKAERRGPATAEEFDWDTFESEELRNSPKYKEYESLYDETLSTIAVDEVVIGTVIQMTLREVVINIGYKSEGVVSLNEFRYNPNLKVGDKVEVYVESQEDKKGQLLLSHKKARAINSWDRVNASLEKDEIITGYIKCRTKGGMIVDVFGIEAFLPGSQIDVKPIRDYDVFVGKTMEFKVVKINQEFKNVVVSHKALIEAELEQQKKEIIAKLEKGQVLEGTVKNITSYGVFIDLGGVDGLIHITDLSWGRVNHPEEIVQLDQKLNVVILDFDDDKKRIALGLKQLTSHPWDSVDPNMNIGDKVKGKVVVMADYGAFVEIAAGVDGLIHISDLSWTKKIKHPAEFTAIDADIDVVVLEIDKENRRLSLGHKQLEENPWDVFENLFTLESIHEGTVVEVFDKGAVIALPYGVEGFVTPKHLVKEDGMMAKVDEKLMFKVIEFNKSAKKIIVSHSRVFEDEKKAAETPVKKEETASPKKTARKPKSNSEKTTLGDISQLAALKEEMEEKENKASKKSKN